MHATCDFLLKSDFWFLFEFSALTKAPLVLELYSKWIPAETKWDKETTMKLLEITFALPWLGESIS